MSYDSNILSGSFQTNEGLDSNILSGSFTTAGFDSNILSGSFTTLASGPTVTGPATMQSAGQAVFTVYDFAGAITSATVSGIDVSASIQQTGDQVTITVPDMFSAGLALRAHEVVLGDGVDSDSDFVDLVAANDWYAITLNGYATIVGETWTRTLAAEVAAIADDDVFNLIDGDIVWYFNAGTNDLVVNADGTYNVDANYSPLTIGRIAYFPDSVDPEAGPDGLYSEMGDYTIRRPRAGRPLTLLPF
jgi:hypothetical protein